MCFRTVLALLAATAVLNEVNAQKRFPPAESPKTPNDLFGESVTRLKDGNFEVDIIVRRPNNQSNPGFGASTNANRKVNNGKIKFPNSSEEQPNESRRSDFEYNGGDHENREFERRREQEFDFNHRNREDQNGHDHRHKNGNELETDNLFNPNTESNSLQRSENPQQYNSDQQTRRNNRRLCEVKYNEYIARIFHNDTETSADANDAEFDGRVLATPGEYPHMTALGFQREDNTFDYKCGGSLISENFVITAAHCTNITSEVPTVARIGDTNLKESILFGPQIFSIQSVYTHPQYDGVTYYNDIALLLLNASVEFTEFVRPIRLWTRPYLPLSTAFAMGYGATSFARAPTQRLTDFNLTIVENNDCNQRLPQLDEVPRGIIDSQVCAQDFLMQRDTCQGDSGGPLQYNIRGRRRRKRIHYHLIGITSFGLLCRSQNPGVYTRIYSFLDWIERTVWSRFEH